MISEEFIGVYILKFIIYQSQCGKSLTDSGYGLIVVIVIKVIKPNEYVKVDVLT